eukprot:7011660-Pyramimonas_sp.AAC.3
MYKHTRAGGGGVLGNLHRHEAALWCTATKYDTSWRGRGWGSAGPYLGAGGAGGGEEQTLRYDMI